MIKAILYISDGEIKGFDVCGHAEYAPYGEVNSLEVQLGQIKAQCSEEGRVTCFLPETLRGEQRLIAQSILKTLEMGLVNIEQAYPDYIRLVRTKIERK